MYIQSKSICIMLIIISMCYQGTLLVCRNIHAIYKVYLFKYLYSCVLWFFAFVSIEFIQF